MEARNGGVVVVMNMEFVVFGEFYSLQDRLAGA